MFSRLHVSVILKIFAEHMNKEKLCTTEAQAACLKVRRNGTPKILKLLVNKEERAQSCQWKICFIKNPPHLQKLGRFQNCTWMSTRS